MKKYSEKQLETFKYVCRRYTPNTKIRSLFGATDIVSINDEIILNDDGECYILCNSGNFRLIFDGKYWADIL